MSFDLKIVNGDLFIDNGDLATISGLDKLKQDILKICLTEIGGEVLQKGYGSLLGKSLIGSVATQNITVSVAQNQLQTSIENLKKLQNIQLQSGQKCSPQEHISYIKNILITNNPIDRRLWQVEVQVLSRAFGLVSTGFTITS